MKTPSTLIALTIVALLLAGCGEKKAASGGHDHGAAAQAAGHADHGDHGPEGEKLTHFSDKTELYVEFPALVVGQAATFVAHSTWLADFKPVTQGKLTVLLAGGSAPEERFVADAPAVPGIFKPNVTPKAGGERELTLIVETPNGSMTHELGPVQVFADAKAAAANHGDHADSSGIPFTKEQQWKIDFATVEAVKGTARPSVAATATIKAQPDGEALLAAPAAGVLRPAGSFPRVGQAVHKGQVLAYLAPRLGGETDQATLEAAAGKARIGLEQARRERERMEALFKDEAIAERRLLEARANERMAEAEANAAQARQAQLGGAGGIAIRAPVAGTLADVAVAPGAFVAEGVPLFHVANTGRLWLEARVPESEIGRLGTPSGASFAVDGFAQPFVIEPGKNGKLIAVGGVVDANTRTVPAIFEFANPGGLRLGMTAKAQLYAGAGVEAVLAPAGAVQDESGTSVVYVQTGGESFERRIVRVGARDGERVAILDGIDPGQRVVGKGAYLIRLSTSMSAAVGHAH
ncbi:MAG: efflux RND transporter periplasmic adaptor subunit [Sulfuritalea sp.]|nr:efflux RND transporter periplasmic adaptor subunit [Sulfuritalea sp.]MBP6636173.1 efflux RND transporter periplasmic adaptor subunit [Sulfuritalea sp.]MBP7422144.1 efflux RND transporter periplasmic adaptor subunit [Sulfuritalea sp.]